MNPIKTTLKRTAVVGIAILTAALALAQTGPKGPGGGPPPRRGPEGPVRPERPMAPGLKPEQRAAIQRVVRKAFAESRAPLARLREVHREMHDAIWAEQPDKELVRQKAREIAKLEVKLAVIRARAVGELRSVLTPRQMERLRNAGPEFWGQLRERIRARIGNPPVQPGHPWMQRQRPGGPDGGAPLPPGRQMRRGAMGPGAGGPPPWAQPQPQQRRPPGTAPAPPAADEQ